MTLSFLSKYGDSERYTSRETDLTELEERTVTRFRVSRKSVGIHNSVNNLERGLRPKT